MTNLTKPSIAFSQFGVKNEQNLSDVISDFSKIVEHAHIALSRKYLDMISIRGYYAKDLVELNTELKAFLESNGDIEDISREELDWLLGTANELGSSLNDVLYEAIKANDKPAIETINLCTIQLHTLVNSLYKLNSHFSTSPPFPSRYPH